MFRIRPRDRSYYLHRPDGCTVLTIERHGWKGNEFGLWLPETVVVDGEIVWCNWRGDPHQDWQEDGDGRWSWAIELDDIEFRAMLEPDPEQGSLWYSHHFTNCGKRPRSEFGTQTCFHLVNAPQFISVHGERIWANLDGQWTTTDQVPRSESPDPNRVRFLREGLRSERTVVPITKFPSAIVPEAAHHPLIVAESFDGEASVGVACRGLKFLFNNNDCILRCIHSEPHPIPCLDPGQTATQEGVVVLCNGDHTVCQDQFERATAARWTAG